MYVQILSCVDSLSDKGMCILVIVYSSILTLILYRPPIKNIDVKILIAIVAMDGFVGLWLSRGLEHL